MLAKLFAQRARKGTLDWYGAAWDSMTYDKEYVGLIVRAADKVHEHKQKFEHAAGKLGGIPWYWIGAAFHLEASCDFRRAMHNGDLVIGNGKKTYNVPKGRGPFNTWTESAVDALAGYKGVPDWPIEQCLLRAERYNGTGYLKYHPEENSPYLWACTSINDGRGKYVSDGRFRSDAPTNGQVGFAAILKELERRGEISVLRHGAQAPA